MKKTAIYLAVVSATFALAFVTSLLLDVHWVQKQWSRTALVLFLMALQLVLGFLVLRAMVKKSTANN